MWKYSTVTIGTIAVCVWWWNFGINWKLTLSPKPPTSNTDFIFSTFSADICLCDNFYSVFVRPSLGEIRHSAKPCCYIEKLKRGIFLFPSKELYMLLPFLYWLFHFQFDNSGAFDNSIKSWQIGQTDWAISQSAHPHSRNNHPQGDPKNCHWFF